MARGRKRIWTGWTLVGLAVAIALTRWFSVDLRTGWAWTIGIGRGNLWVERDWYLIESDDTSIEFRAIRSPGLNWRLQDWDLPLNPTSLTRLDLWFANYQEFVVGNRKVWGMNVLLWPFGAVALGGGVPLIVSGKCVRRLVNRGACERCGYDLKGLAPEASCPECGKVR